MLLRASHEVPLRSVTALYMSTLLLPHGTRIPRAQEEGEVTEIMQQFGLPLKIIAWGYIVIQAIALLIAVPAIVMIFWRVWRVASSDRPQA